MLSESRRINVIVSLESHGVLVEYRNRNELRSLDIALDALLDDYSQIYDEIVKEI